MPKNPVGNPEFVPKWSSHTKTIRLPEIFEEVLVMVARSLDSGAITPEELQQLLINYSTANPPEEPTAKEVISLIEGLKTSISNSGGWEWTAKEAGLVVHVLEQTTKTVDDVFAEKAKQEVMIAKAVAEVKRTRKPRAKKPGDQSHV